METMHYDKHQKAFIEKNIAALEQQIGYAFSDKRLIAQAFTHSSYANENGNVMSNERLEFLGDAVLELCVSDYLYDKFPKLSEGNLTRLRAKVVCEDNLSVAAKNIHLGDYLVLGIGASQTVGSRERPGVLCDAFEALIGAIYKDSNRKQANAFVHKFAIEVTDLSDHTFSPNDYKGKLQDTIQKNGVPIIQYIILSESGPDHSKQFVAQVSAGDRILATGKGKSKKEAEQVAAKNALDKL